MGCERKWKLLLAEVCGFHFANPRVAMECAFVADWRRRTNAQTKWKLLQQLCVIIHSASKIQPPHQAKPAGNEADGSGNSSVLAIALMICAGRPCWYTRMVPAHWGWTANRPGDEGNYFCRRLHTPGSHRDTGMAAQPRRCTTPLFWPEIPISGPSCLLGSFANQREGVPCKLWRPFHTGHNTLHIYTRAHTASTRDFALSPREQSALLVCKGWVFSWQWASENDCTHSYIAVFLPVQKYWCENASSHEISLFIFVCGRRRLAFPFTCDETHLYKISAIAITCDTPPWF